MTTTPGGARHHEPTATPEHPPTPSLDRPPRRVRPWTTDANARAAVAVELPPGWPILSRDAARALLRLLIRAAQRPEADTNS